MNSHSETTFGDLAWHFLASENGKPVLLDGRPAVLGEWVEHDGDVVICASGLHASRRVLDACRYAPTNTTTACLVEVEGVVTEHSDKLVCRRRRIVAWCECSETLRLFARLQAQSVLHPWDAPQIVRDYLETGDEDLRAAARAAAWAAAADAARAAASVDAAYAAYAADAYAAASAAASVDAAEELESMLLGQMEWA